MPGRNVWTGEVDMNLLHRRTSQCLLHLTPTSFWSLAILVADGTLRDEQPDVFSPSLPVSNLLQFLSGFLYPKMSIDESSMRVLKKLTPQRMRYNHLLILDRCIWPLVSCDTGCRLPSAVTDAASIALGFPDPHCSALYYFWAPDQAAQAT